MANVVIWVIVAIVVLLIAAGFAGRRGMTRTAPLEGATPYDRTDRNPGALNDPGGTLGPSDFGGGGGSD